MPFTFQWDNISPADPTAANLLGADIRNLRAAIQERMDAVFTDPSGSWLNSGPASPIVLAPAIVSSSAKSIGIHHSAFVPSLLTDIGLLGSNNADTITRTQQYLQVNNPGGAHNQFSRTLYAPLILAEFPLGVSIGSVNFRVDNSASGATIACKLCVEDTATQVVTVLGTINAANTPGTVQQLSIIGPFSTVVLLGVVQQFFLEIDITIPVNNNATPLIYGAFVSYTCPDARNTV